MKRIVPIALTAFLYAAAVAAYDQFVVHRRMSRLAFRAAQAQINFLDRIGMKPTDTLGGDPVERVVSNGAEDEDVGTRSLNHFYDPLHESPLVVMKPVDGCIPIPALSGDFTARQWALITPTNTFGIAAARQQLVGLITAPSADTRKQHGIEFFQSLGHIIHLIQDMAQPQHTRNDAHPTSDEKTFDFEDPDPQAFLDKLNLWSRYERWCKQHLNTDQNPSSTSFYTGYPIVKLPSNGAFFKAGDGRGLAEYANRNFVTEHTNYSDLECAPFYFDEPSLVKAIPRQETHHVDTTIWNEETQTLTVKTATYNDIVYSYPVYDAYTGSTNVDQNHAFRSYYDYELNKVEKDPVFSLPESALASKANLLVRRAVSYSAGFLVHFFRGSVDANWAKNADGSYNLTLKNTSAEPLSRIRLRALYRVTPGTHGAGPGDDLVPIVDLELDPSLILAPGGLTTLPQIFVPGLDPAENLKAFERRIAVVGTLGSEPGVTVGLVQPAITVRSAFFDFENLAYYATAHITQPAYSFSVGLRYNETPQRVVVFYGTNALRNSPVAASGVALANGIFCLSCRVAWNRGWTVIAFEDAGRFTPGPGVSNIRFSLGNSATATQPQTYRIGYTSAHFSPDPPFFADTIQVTLQPGERRTIALPFTNIWQIGISNVTQTGEWLFAIDDFAFDYEQ